jgi:hypothetical protein
LLGQYDSKNVLCILCHSYALFKFCMCIVSFETHLQNWNQFDFVFFFHVALYVGMEMWLTGGTNRKIEMCLLIWIYVLVFDSIQLPIYHILKFGTVNICCITHSRWKLHQSSFIRQDVIPSLAHNLIQSIFFCYIIKVLCLLRVVWHCLPLFLVNKR